MYFTTIPSPVGELTVTATDRGLSGVYFENHQHPPKGRSGWIRDDGTRFDEVKSWFSRYLEKRKRPPFSGFDLSHGTEFQQRVWNALTRIPTGETTTYQEMANQIDSPKGVRAVGAAVGKNPISIIIPCHRVIGSNGKLTGFAGGLERKQWLLVHEGLLCL
ncbi:MAG: methylated-DNA--[protein]-cysteine S-methyltransferase [Verrucomicrobiota bacterium]